MYIATVEMIMTTKLEILEKRIDSAMTARDRCAEGSWGEDYWSKVVAHLMRQLNRYVNGEKLLIHEYNNMN